MENENQEFTFIMHTEEGDVEMTTLFTFFSEMTKAHYMIYAPTSQLDSDTQVQVSACRYDPENLTKIYPLKDDTDRQTVQAFLNYVSTHSQEEIAAATQADPFLS